MYSDSLLRLAFAMEEVDIKAAISALSQALDANPNQEIGIDDLGCLKDFTVKCEARFTAQKEEKASDTLSGTIGANMALLAIDSGVPGARFRSLAELDFNE